MDEKLQKKVGNFIDSIYWVYVMAGLMYAAEILKGLEPKTLRRAKDNGFRCNCHKDKHKCRK